MHVFWGQNLIKRKREWCGLQIQTHTWGWEGDPRVLPSRHAEDKSKNQLKLWKYQQYKGETTKSIGMQVWPKRWSPRVQNERPNYYPILSDLLTDLGAQTTQDMTRNRSDPTRTENIFKWSSFWPDMELFIFGFLQDKVWRSGESLDQVKTSTSFKTRQINQNISRYKGDFTYHIWPRVHLSCNPLTARTLKQIEGRLTYLHYQVTFEEKAYLACGYLFLCSQCKKVWHTISGYSSASVTCPLYNFLKHQQRMTL